MGIGRRQAAKLEKQGVKTAYDFTQLFQFMGAQEHDSSR